MQKRVTRKDAYLTLAGILAALVLGVVLLALLCRGIGSAVSQVANGPVFSATPLPTETTQQKLAGEIQHYFTDQTTFETAGDVMTITVPDYLATTKMNLQISIGEFYKWAYTTSWVRYNTIDINVWSDTFKDAYGHPQHLRVGYALLTRTTANKFNWDNVYYPDAWKLYDQAILNPAVSW